MSKKYCWSPRQELKRTRRERELGCYENFHSIAGAMTRNSLIGYVATLMLVLAHGWRNNTMMTYVEKHAFDGTGSAQ